MARFIWKLKTVYPEIDANILLNEMKLAWVEIKFDPKTKAVISTTPEKVKIDIDAIPKYQMDTFCRSTLNLTKKMFENPEFAAKYEVWLAKRKAKQAMQVNV